MKKVTRQAFVRSIDFDARTITLVASTDRLCPDNMLILSRAWQQDYDAWLKSNPVVLAFHDYHSWAIGHVTEGRIEDGKLIETIAFDDVNPEAVVAWSLYSKGHQRAASVGWDTIEADPNLPIGEVIARYGADLSSEAITQLNAVGKAKYASDRKITVITRAKKLETSLVPVPMDDKAVVVHSTPESFFLPQRRITIGLLEAAEKLGIQFEKPCTDCRSERPGWEDTNPDDPEDGQIRYRIKEPGLFKEGSFRTLSLDVKGDGDVQLIRGRLKSNDEWSTQAVHFNKKDGWTMAQAKDWYSEHKDSLEEKAKTDGEQRIGKVLSAKNKAAIESAIAALQEVLTLAEGEPEEKTKPLDELKARVEAALANAELRRKLKEICAGT